MKKILIKLFVAATTIVSLSQCKKEHNTPHNNTHAPVDPNLASFENLKIHIFDHSCVSCHNPSQSGNTNGGLILTGSNVYENLVNVTAFQTQANAAGAILVKPGNADSSYLYVKSNFDNSTIYRFGNAMPLGGDPLSSNEILFIKQWIDAGAPKTGVVADPALLSR